VPPGTVFYIGLPSQLTDEPGPGRLGFPDQDVPHRVENRLDQSVAPSENLGGAPLARNGAWTPDPMRFQTPRIAPGQAPQVRQESDVRTRESDPESAPGPAIVSDPAYRGGRIVELLERAARAGEAQE
jgi:hypothetical protein